MNQRIPRASNKNFDLTDDDFADLAASSFQVLDEEETRRADHDQLLADLKASSDDEVEGRLHDAEDVFAEIEAKYNIAD